MWIVRVALDRPYTFVVAALMILITSVVVVARTPTDIFPSIDIPVIAVDWAYTGLNPEEVEGRLTSVYERVLNDLGQNFLRPQLVTVPGAVIPYAYGGKQRQMMINLVPELMQAKSVSPTDVLNAVNNQSVVLPSGTVKVGEFEYDTAQRSRWVIIATIIDRNTGQHLRETKLGGPELEFDDPVKCKAIVDRVHLTPTDRTAAVLTCREVGSHRPANNAPNLVSRDAT